MVWLYHAFLFTLLFFSAKGAIMWWDGGRRRTFFFSGTHGKDWHLPRIVLPNAYARKKRSKIDAFAPISATADASLTTGGSKSSNRCWTKDSNYASRFYRWLVPLNIRYLFYICLLKRLSFCFYWAPRKRAFSFFGPACAALSGGR